MLPKAGQTCRQTCIGLMSIGLDEDKARGHWARQAYI